VTIISTSFEQQFRHVKSPEQGGCIQRGRAAARLFGIDRRARRQEACHGVAITFRRSGPDVRGRGSLLAEAQTGLRSRIELGALGQAV
jgi:hypothetical protein